LVLDCYFGSGLATAGIQTGDTQIGLLSVIGCAFDSVLARVTGTRCALFDGCIFIGAATAIDVNGKPDVIKNCVFYLQTDKAIKANESTGSLICYNNIFYLAAVDDHAVYVESGLGSVISLRNNCAYSAAGVLTNAFYDESNSRDLIGTDNILENPDFVDAGNNDFRCRNKNVLRGSMQDLAGNASPMGAIGQEYQFANANRSRGANMARLGIFR